MEVLSHVASTSFTDLFNVKLSCKYFLEEAKDDYIFQRISLAKFPIFPLCISNEASSFLKCEEFGNPKSLFRQRMIDYFSLMMIESELVCLNEQQRKVIQKQHTYMGLSCYVLKVN